MEKELSKPISHLKNNKSPGLDNISNNMIKHSQTVLLKSLQNKGLGAIRAKIGPTSDVDNIFSKMCSQYVLFRNTYS